MQIPGKLAMNLVRENRSVRKYPSKSDARFKNGAVFPGVSPRFFIENNCTIFTIGSCFARNVEEKLAGNYALPTMAFSVPKSEYPTRSNGLLNEYNPGTMCQRIVWALSGQTIGEELIAEEGSGYVDLLLAAGPPVTRDRLFERRREIDNVYKSLVRSDVVIITLGLIECWYDTQLSLYLNRMPPERLLMNDSDRYEFHILGVDESYTLLETALSKLIQSGITKILLTVSPVPLMATFSGLDCVTANSFSKSVLRVCSDELCRKYQEVDYFPSYEIVVSKGHEAYRDDNIHVSDDVVGSITQYLIDSYILKSK